jgi:hypothetical protein
MRAMPTEISYTRSRDGVSIAYDVQGAGPSVVVLPPFAHSFAAPPVPGPGLPLRFMRVRYDAGDMGSRPERAVLQPRRTLFDLEAAEGSQAAVTRSSQ